MYIKKSVLVFCAITLIVATVLSTICVINPFGASEWEKFITFTRVGKLLDTLYYEDIESEEYFNNAIDGLARAVDDPYTRYLWGEEKDEFLEDIEGNYKGVGMYIENDTRDNTISVVSSIAGSPAEEAGITTGDKILKIDGQPITGEEIEEASSRIKGVENTSVKITLLRKATGTVEEIELIRREIIIPNIEGEMLENGIGRINITQFSEGVADNFQNKFFELKESGMNKLIIDLRNNPGGIMDEVIKIADLFIEKENVIVYTENKLGERVEYKAKKDAMEIPIVILTNIGSASASEVLTGALKDYDKAYQIGEKTFGKGVVQGVFEIPEQGILSVTTARYFTPDGVCIHEEGITPDETVEMSVEKYINLSRLSQNDDEQLQAALRYLNK